MCLKLSKKQFLVLIIFALVGGLFGYITTPTYLCIPGPCPQPSPTPYLISGFLFFGVLTYLIEVIYNYFSDRK